MTKFGKSSSRVIFLRLCSIQKRPTFSHFGLSCDLCRECRKRDVWLIYLFLSILSSSTCATAAPSDTVTTHLHLWLGRINGSFEKSDALLYAPMLNEISENCKNMSLICYMYELEVIIIEEELKNEEPEIYYLKKLLPSHHSSVSCPPCEAQTLEPATKFLQNFMELLQHMNSQQAGL